MPVLELRQSVPRSAALIICCLLANGCSSNASAPPQACTDAPYQAKDPGESVNRKVFAFNRTLDDYAIAPIARGYRRRLPQPVQDGVHNFTNNLGEPRVFINDILQGNGVRSINTLGRFLINSTAGVVGLFDISGRLGIERHQSDFGQTFGVWNIANGPTVELPMFGTNNLRDASGRVLNLLVNPLGGNSDTLEALNTAGTVGGVVDGRATALPLTDRLQKEPDYYVALRDAVAQRRANFVVEGKTGIGRTCTAPMQERLP